MPKAALTNMWLTLEKGGPWNGIVKNRCKNGDRYWVRTSTVPMVREGRISSYMSIRTRAADEEITAVEPLYKAPSARRTSKHIHKGLMVHKDWLGKLPSLPPHWRACGVMTLMFILLAVILWFVTAPVVTYFLCVLVVLLTGTYFEWQIARSIGNVAHQVLEMATRKRNGVKHLNRSDELGLTLRVVGQLDLICRWLINDVSSQVSSVRDGSETLAKGTDELNGHAQQTVDNVQQTMATMSQMAASVRQNLATVSAANELSITTSDATVQSGEAITAVVKTMDDIAGSTQRTGTITSLINDIAFQTNILALNAAVETARAGRQSEGSAVVAEEVRHLTSRSANATNNIRKLINASADRMQPSSQQVHAAGQTTEDIVAQVKNVIQLITQIGHSTLKQTDGLSGLTRAMSKLNPITQKDAELVEESV